MWPVAVITFLEGVRNRVLYGIFVFALLVILLSIIFANFFMQEIGKVAVDFNLSAISLAGLLVSLSLSVSLISKDLDKKTIYFVLSRPVSRAGYVLGKYLGLLLLVFFSYVILIGVTCLALWFLNLQYGPYFSSFSWVAYFQAIYFDFLKIAMFNAIIVLFSSITTSSFITMLFSVMIYVVGQTITDVVNILAVNISDQEVSPMVEFIINISKYVVPNFSVFDFKVISAHGLFVSVDQAFFISLYGIFYSAIVLVLSAVFFSKKEFL